MNDSPTPTSSRPSPARSITVRLPLLILALLSVVIAGLGWSSYHQLTGALERSVSNRLQSAATQISGMLRESNARAQKSAARLAANPDVVQAVTHRDPSAVAAARIALADSLTSATESVTRTIWSRDCELILAVGQGASALAPGKCPSSPERLHPVTRIGGDGAWVQPFRLRGDTVSYDVIAPVLATAGDTVGFVVATRTLHSNESGKVVGRLIGKDVSFMLGNANGPPVWTDLSQRVDGPSLPAHHEGAFDYEDASGVRQFGLSSELELAPWTIWLQLPYQEVVEPAVHTMADLGLIALAGLLIAVMGAWVVSRHVTSPILELAGAAEDLAGGNYGRRVSSSRRDELGALVGSFNRMASEVQQSHDDLQAQAVELELHAEQSQDLAHELELSNQELSEALDEAMRARGDTTRVESLLDEVLLQAPVGIAVFDTEMRYVRLNQVVADLHGVPLHEHFGKRPSELRPVLGEIAEPLIEQVLRTGEKVVNQRLSAAMHGDARRHWIANCFPIRDANRELTGVGAILVDTTERQELEAQFLQAQKMEAVGRLAGGIAHDFNNLLTVINSYSSLALGSLRREDPLYEDMTEIKGASERAARLTRQLLAFSRKQVMRPQPLDLSRLTREMERMLQRLIGEDVTLELALASDVGIISADPGQVEQVIMNLVVNARDAMPNGGHLSIETSNVDFSSELSMTKLGRPAGQYVVLSVSDTGTGMSAETQANLFEPFFTTKGPGRGTGLGLSTVYGIVKQSGGDIHVRSEPGRGSSFRIYFPRIETEEPGEQRRAARPGKALTGAETILLVEDDDSLRHLTARILRDAGYNVLDTRAATEAVLTGTHHEGNIDLLLTDVVMPEMNGRTVAELLTRQRPEINVLFMSGYTDDDVVRRGVLATGAVFLQKPFAPEDLLLQVRTVLDNQEPFVA